MLYNPQLKRMYEINFDWIFEATEENLQKLIDEVWRLFSIAQGETATERKYRKVREYAQKNNIELMPELPDGWKMIKGAMTAPCGSELICNGESLRSGKMKTALLISR